MRCVYSSKFLILVISLILFLISCTNAQEKSKVNENLRNSYSIVGTLVPKGFTAPNSLVLEKFTLLPLVPEFCELDYAAISSNVDHLKGTFGPNTDWPQGMTYQDNLEDLEIHQELFEGKLSFAYSVFSPDCTEIIGCVYITPIEEESYDASVTFWLTEKACDTGLDTLLYYSLKLWLKEEWPFKSVAFPGRDFSYDIWYNTKLNKEDSIYKNQESRSKIQGEIMTRLKLQFLIAHSQ